MLLQNLDRNTNTEFENTENDSQIMWPNIFTHKQVFAIRETENHCLKNTDIKISKNTT